VWQCVDPPGTPLEWHVFFEWPLKGLAFGNFIHGNLQHDYISYNRPAGSQPDFLFSHICLQCKVAHERGPPLLTCSVTLFVQSQKNSCRNYDFTVTRSFFKLALMLASLSGFRSDSRSTESTRVPRNWTPRFSPIAGTTEVTNASQKRQRGERRSVAVVVVVVVIAVVVDVAVVVTKIVAIKRLSGKKTPTWWWRCCCKRRLGCSCCGYHYSPCRCLYCCYCCC
jgi:hypothetical protein